jgi:hypothetical protein
MYSEMRRSSKLTVVAIVREITLGDSLSLVVLLLVQPNTLGQLCIESRES